jgi:hypothetical protein
MDPAMSEKSEPSVIASLPHARPQRRSDKRAVKPAAAPAPEPQLEAAGALGPDEPPSQERSDPAAHDRDQDQDQDQDQDPHNRCPASLAEGAELVGTVVRATAELAEIGLTLGARMLRGALARLPRP